MTATTDQRSWYLGGPEEVGDGVVRLPMPVGVRELHAVNVYVLSDRDGAIDLIDAGDASEVAVHTLDEALRGIGGGVDAVRRVLVTHVHPDHYTLAPPIRARAGATVHLGSGERENVRQINRLIRGEREVQVLADLERVGATALTRELEPGRLNASRGGDELAEPDVWTVDGERIRAGRGDVTALATPGHTRGHVVFHDQEQGRYFSGDHVLPHITPSIGFESAPVSSALADYLGSLRRLLELPDGVLLPAHGPTAPSTHARVRELLDHHETRLAQTLDAVQDRGSTPFEVARRLTWTRHERRFAELHAWHRFLASTETAAHLEVLVDRRLLDRAPGGGGADVYRPAGGCRVA
ncbi:MBL fold metallo-hydrolase [Phytohabitans suffuscus]|uniref:MBL fold metallo-hydrolase n=1 Tax=Phytohabitans suffuscus TaxID=624315 RepID=A0A6F8YVC7_9ACTN|nr:MBL fold metallo-hydrolase [Phytohabitans suffuscus]BCB89888.1 MBL fold metallo-hydrolase [Phytohabitans suffuscus]